MNKRYSLAVKYIQQGENLKRRYRLPHKVKGLCLDREFFTVEVINYLYERQIPFIMPCVLRGRYGGIKNLLWGVKADLPGIQCIIEMVNPHSKLISW